MQPGAQVIEWTHREGQRRSKLVADVREQAAARAVELPQLLRLEVLDLEPALEAKSVHLVASHAVEGSQSEQPVRRVRPPGSPPRGKNENGEGRSSLVPQAIVVAGPHLELVAARREVRICR